MHILYYIYLPFICLVSTLFLEKTVPPLKKRLFVQHCMNNFMHTSIHTQDRFHIRMDQGRQTNIIKQKNCRQNFFLVFILALKVKKENRDKKCVFFSIGKSFYYTKCSDFSVFFYVWKTSTIHLASERDSD